MNNLERFLRDRNADADTWIDDEGLHVRSAIAFLLLLQAS